MERQPTRAELIENHVEALRGMLSKVGASTALAQRLRNRISDIERDLAEQKEVAALYDATPAGQRGTIGFSQDAIDKFNRAFAADLEAERTAFEAECEK